MSWKRGAAVVLVILTVVQMVFVAYEVPSSVTTVINNYLGLRETDVWQITAQNSAARRKWLQAYLEEREVRVKEVDCRKVLDGDREELNKANLTERHSAPPPLNARIFRMAKNCSQFVRHYGFLLDPLTKLEEEFPIAFSILAFKQASQVVDLLRAIYRPQNWYCLHVDRKSPPDFRLALEAVSGCFPNVFLASRSIDVRWGFFTVLEPEIVCMGDLWKKKAWKYFINLTGQEFPLRTNYELVRILQAYNGANDVSAHVPNNHTINYRWRKFLPSPHNITLYKGAIHVAVSRAFVDYVLHSPKAQAFLQWCRQTRHPDEHFFNSLNNNPHLHVPGGTKGRGKITRPGTMISHSAARFKNWVPAFPCPGRKVVRALCVLNVLDLPLLRTRREMFANKFYAQHSRVALRCLAEDLHNRTREQALGKSAFNVSHYERFDFVRNRLW